MTNITAFVGYGGWIPKHPDIHKNFIKNLVKHARDSARRSHKHEPAVAAFAKAIEDGGMRPLFDQTFKQIRKPQGNHTLKRFDPDHQVENFEELLQALDQIVVTAPKYHVVRYPNGDVIGEPIGVPIYIVLDLLSNTSAGYDLFRMKPFNDAMKNLLDSWGKFLMEAGSNNTLNKTAEGWFGELGIRNLSQNLGTYTFDQTFKCPDPSADNRGFKSWDAFFTRELQDGVRPIDTNGIILQPGRSPHTAGLHPPTIIYSPSESTVVRIADNVQRHDQFWLKGQQYSLYDMLDHDDEYAKRFEGGTVYQSFLSPSDYHRWHSPIKGTIEKIVMVEGTYYAALPDDGAEEGDPDLEQGDPHGALIRSMPFLTVSAARALIYIKSHDNTIGTVCFIAVGMVEVSTCQLTVKENDPVEPGTQLGMFHFGGSSSVIIFPTGVKFTPYKEHGVQLGKHVWVNSVLGIAERV
ncbi:phosphatidylserine decarboxylase [Suillus ampliporus]|nr:phosphatidylserine decarboxylase [Suillus ampliporus]